MSCTDSVLLQLKSADLPWHAELPVHPANQALR
jgi:hypothetical protein